MRFPTALDHIDEFDRVESPLSQNGAWASPMFTSDDPLETVAGGTVRSPSAGSASAYRVTQTGPDCEALVIIPTVGATGDSLFFSVRNSNPNNDIYNDYGLLVSKEAGTDTWGVYRGDAGVGTQLGANISQEFSNGNGAGISVNGTMIFIWHYDGSAWSQLDTRSDSTSTHQRGGYIGFGLIGGTFRAGNFRGGTFIPYRVDYSNFPKLKLQRAA